jgi:hypothetical protein
MRHSTDKFCRHFILCALIGATVGPEAFAGYFKDFTWQQFKSTQLGIFVPEFYPTKSVIISGGLFTGNQGSSSRSAFESAVLDTGVELWTFVPERQPVDARNSQIKTFRIGPDTADIWVRDWSPIFQIQKSTHKVSIVDFDADMESMPVGRLEVGMAWQKRFPSIKRISLPLVLDGGNMICNSKLCLISDRVIDDNSMDSVKHQKFLAIMKATTTGINECNAAGACVYTPTPSKYLNEKTLNSDSDFTIDATISNEAKQKKMIDLMSNLTSQAFVVLPRIPGEPTGHMDMFASFLGEKLLLLADVPQELISQLSRPEDQAAATQLKAELDKWNSILTQFFIRNNAQIKIVRIPMPIPHFDANNPVWPSYTNLLQINHAGKHTLILPSYQPNGEEIIPLQTETKKLEASVESTLVALGYFVKWIDATKLIVNEGSLHCVTANVPLGL